MHKLSNYTLNDLENLVEALHRQVKFTIEYIGFTGLIWPRSQTIIQMKRKNLE
ncbi:hypothetical protein FC76_GL000363 [Lactiplantibacillus plantarum subsp. plantarum ATCC 14917 = JCM 1149 = CGMCC 1.2437]|nr:hypothetical protein FC76_GL000363 [Lactiplantibacillus plantarum subsp. plantarum ATCC 14917 = JCM 1149 = CGMCC 1.2437]